MAHVFVEDLDGGDGGVVVVADEDRHHLERVLRLRVGEAVSASDGRGGFRPCVFAGSGRLEPVGDVERSPAPSPSLGVGFALVKGTKPEWIVQKLTECGIDRIVPFVAERSVVRWDEAKAASHVVRWRRVAVEAAMQSRRRWLPDVAPLRPFAEVAEGGGVVLADLDGSPPSIEGPAPGVGPLVLVGPEGGWSDAERAAAGGRSVRFGPTTLRAETAAVAAGVLLSALRDGAVRPEEGRAARS